MKIETAKSGFRPKRQLGKRAASLVLAIMLCCCYGCERGRHIQDSLGVNGFESAKTYAEVSSKLKGIVQKQRAQKWIDSILRRRFYWGQTLMLDSAVEMESVMPMASGLGGMSATNNQTAGIDEMDIMKSNGESLFIIANGVICAYSLNDGAPALEAVLGAGLPNPKGLFLHGNTLVCFFSGYDRGKAASIVHCYNISNPKEPILARQLKLEGRLETARMLGSKVYTATKAAFSGDWDHVPMYSDNGEQWRKVAAANIALAPDPSSENYIVASAFDVVDLSQKASVIAAFGCGETIYCAHEALYAIGLSGRRSVSTLIARFEFGGPGFGHASLGSVDGVYNNTFSFGEHNSFLRVALERDRMPLISILDDRLNIVSEVELEAARRENIKSVRFMGDIGYVVTFLNTDPLFVVDLSDPYCPMVLGELEVPGFSSYLHPIGNKSLLGIGTAVWNTYKLSLFSVSNPYNPIEITTLELAENLMPDIIGDHRVGAFLSSANLFFSPSTDLGEYSQSIEAYTVTAGSLEHIASIENGPAQHGINRALASNGILYAINAKSISCYDIRGFAHISDTVLAPPTER
ncbi:MAG: beta-propeller domain-containing protein [Eubacteriaceae bacterium]|nr:beta-propeller domain-containing protein [Eubacteriaceae bacterium]